VALWGRNAYAHGSEIRLFSPREKGNRKSEIRGRTANAHVNDRWAARGRVLLALSASGVAAKGQSTGGTGKAYAPFVTEDPGVGSVTITGVRRFHTGDIGRGRNRKASIPDTLDETLLNEMCKPQR
jgi:hypothetical protein